MIGQGWKRYPATELLHRYASCFYQKKLFKDENENDVYAEIIEYSGWKNIEKCWELHIQINGDISITGQTINILEFAYNELNFEKIETNALNLINPLIKIESLERSVPC